MLLKKEIEAVYNSQNSLLFQKKDGIVNRELLSKMNDMKSHIEILSGIRRCGKSTLMHQLIQNNYKSTAFLNFEEPQLFNFDINDFGKLLEVMGQNKDAYFFDEIQIVDGWEIFIRSLHDKNKKIFVTGSNASMLSSELGTRLTGRYVQRELFPFSYSEFLNFMNYQDNDVNFLDYMTKGGFPEYLNQNENEILYQLYRDILFRDIVVRYKVKNSYELEEISLYLLSNIAKEITFNSIKKFLKIASTTTVSNYISWLQDSYLIFLVPRFSYSAKSILLNPKKVYAIDNGLVNSITLSKSQDSGRLLENLIFLHFRKTNLSIYYFRNNGECDFILFDNKEFVSAVQVCINVNSDNKAREINGIVEALNFFNKNSGIIVTLNQEDEIIEDNKKIKLIPVRKFLQTDFRNLFQ